MFFVFGPQGQMFRGGPERLSQVAPVRRVQRPQALRTRASDMQAPPDAPPPAAPGAAPSPAEPAGILGRTAIDAYASTEKGPQQPRQPLQTVADVMTRGAVTVGLEDQVNQAWRSLAEHQVAQAPVLNGLGVVVGLLLRADMAALDLLPEPGAIAQAIALAQRPVSAVMVSPVPTVAQDTALRQVAGVLLDTGLPGLPVTDEAGQLMGFVSRTDILRAVAADPPLDLWS